MGPIRNRAEANCSALSLTPRPPTQCAEPAPRPLASLSPLERALVAKNASGVKTLLLAGADPDLVCRVRLGDAAKADEHGAACARLIQVAIRMKRLQITPPASPATAAIPPGGDKALNSAVASGAHFADCFSRKKTTESGPNRDGPITRALKNYDIDTATEALQETTDLPRLFNPRRHHDRLVGMLALNQTGKLAAWHEKGLLHPSKTPANDLALKSFLKQFSHRRAPGHGTRLARLNGRARFENTNEQIVCRHLAVHWLLHRPLKSNGKIDYATLNSKKSVKQAFRKEDQEAFEYYTNNCTDSHLVENDRWGQFLASQFHELQQPAADSKLKSILICSDNHAMACELSIKQGVDNEPLYAVNFYDPNFTNVHRRVRAADMAAIESISMARLINQKGMSDAYYQDQSLSIAFVIDERMARPVSADRLPYQGTLPIGAAVTATPTNTAATAAAETIAARKLSSRPSAYRLHVLESRPFPKSKNAVLATGNLLFHLVHYGFSGELDAVFSEFSAMPDKEMQVSAFNRPQTLGGATPLIDGILFGFEHTVTAFTKGILAQENLSGDQKTRILSHQCTIQGFTVNALQAALKSDQTKIIGNFTSQILASDALSPDQQCRILDTKFKGKNLIQYFAAGVAVPQSGNAFREAVVASGVSPDMRLRLLG